MTDEPSVSSSASDHSDGVSAMFRRRFDEYITQWEGAADKVRRSEYHAEDLLDDCFRFWGNALRDATTIATLMWRAADVNRRGGSARRQS